MCVGEGTQAGQDVRARVCAEINVKLVLSKLQTHMAPLVRRSRETRAIHTLLHTGTRHDASPKLSNTQASAPRKSTINICRLTPVHSARHSSCVGKSHVHSHTYTHSYGVTNRPSAIVSPTCCQQDTRPHRCTYIPYTYVTKSMKKHKALIPVPP